MRHWVFLALLLSALSLAPSITHVLEAPPRLWHWSPELWRDATVFGGQFAFLGQVAGAVDMAAVMATATLALKLRGQGWAIAAAVLFAAALSAWFWLVAPVNAVLATWQPGPVPPDFDAVRLRWETGHAAVAALKLGGYVALCQALLRRE